MSRLIEDCINSIQIIACAFYKVFVLIFGIEEKVITVLGM